MENETFETVENETYEAPVAETVEQSVAYEQEFEGAAEETQEFAADNGSVLDKVKALPKKIWALVAAGVVAVIALIVVLSILGNTYKTPIKAAEKLLNTKSVSKIIDKAPTLLNGFGDSEAKKLIKIAKKSDQYKDMIEDAEDAFEEATEMLKDEYGKNYKIEIKVEDKEKLEKDDVRDFRDQLRDISDLADNLDDLDSDDYEDMADELGISKGQAKDAVKELKKFCKECKSAKVSAGYELEIVVSIDGSEAEEPTETEMTVRVFKVDGRWVPDVFSLVENLGMGALGSVMNGF